MNKLLSGVDQIEPAEMTRKATERCNQDAAGQVEPTNSPTTKPSSTPIIKKGGSFKKKTKKTSSEKGSDDDDSSSSDESDRDQFDADVEEISSKSNNNNYKKSSISSLSGVTQTQRMRLMSVANAATAKSGGSALSTVKGSCLYQLELQDSSYKVTTYPTYGSLFKQLSSEGIIPLGLLRGVFPGCSLGPTGNTSPYVFTNPDKDTQLHKCDKVYVLSIQPIKSTKKLDMKVCSV